MNSRTSVCPVKNNEGYTTCIPLARGNRCSTSWDIPFGKYIRHHSANVVRNRRRTGTNQSNNRLYLQPGAPNASKTFPRPHPPASELPRCPRLSSRKIVRVVDIQMSTCAKFQREGRRERHRTERRRPTQNGRWLLAKRERGRKTPLQIQSNGLTAHTYNAGHIREGSVFPRPPSDCRTAC